MSAASDYAQKLAQALHAQGRYSEAESAYRVALYDLPEDASLYVGLGDCLRELGRRADALDAYLAAVEFEPDRAAGHYGLGLCELHPLRRMHAFAEAVRCEPTHTGAHLALGEALLVLRRHEDALEALRRARELSPDDLEVASRAGESLIAARQIHDAVHFLEEAISEHPIGDHSAAPLGKLYRALAQALAILGRSHDATEAFRAADYLLPDLFETTEPDGGTEPEALSIAGFAAVPDSYAEHYNDSYAEHYAEHYAELTDPDAELTDPDGETTAPPS